MCIPSSEVLSIVLEKGRSDDENYALGSTVHGAVHTEGNSPWGFPWGKPLVPKLPWPES